MNKVERDSQRAAVWAAYESRIASQERDTRAGRAALRLYMLMMQIGSLLFFIAPAYLVQFAVQILGPNETMLAVGNIIIFGGFFLFFFRILIPVSYDVVWRMDIFSNKRAFVRPVDVYRLSALWMSPTGKDLPILRRWFRNA